MSPTACVLSVEPSVLHNIPLQQVQSTEGGTNLSPLQLIVFIWVKSCERMGAETVKLVWPGTFTIKARLKDDALYQELHQGSETNLRAAFLVSLPDFEAQISALASHCMSGPSLGDPLLHFDGDLQGEHGNKHVNIILNRVKLANNRARLLRNHVIR